MNFLMLFFGDDIQVCPISWNEYPKMILMCHFPMHEI